MPAASIAEQKYLSRLSDTAFIGIGHTEHLPLAGGYQQLTVDLGHRPDIGESFRPGAQRAANLVDGFVGDAVAGALQWLPMSFQFW